MRHAKPVDNGFEKIDGTFAALVGDGHGLDPLGEFCRLRPRGRRGLLARTLAVCQSCLGPTRQRARPAVWALARILARVAFPRTSAGIAPLDDVLGVVHCGWPVEPSS